MLADGLGDWEAETRCGGEGESNESRGRLGIGLEVGSEFEGISGCDESGWGSRINGCSGPAAGTDTSTTGGSLRCWGPRDCAFALSLAML